MLFLSWFSILTLLGFTALYIYWTCWEERAKPAWVRASFYGGLTLFGVMFGVMTWHTLSVVPAQTHAEALTAGAVSGKVAWQKNVCINCHTILGNGAYYGPDLTKAWPKYVARAGGDSPAARAAMVRFLRNPPRATAQSRGMYQYQFSEEEANQLVDFLKWTSEINTNGWPPEPLHALRSAAAGPPATGASAEGQSLLAKHGCTACHSVGEGRVVGPDLSGVGSRYDRASLMLWLHDPESLYRARGRKPINPGHPEMPAPGMTQGDAEAVTGYLLTLRSDNTGRSVQP